MPSKFFNWPPFRLVAFDADTGKPLDANVGQRVYRKCYSVRKDGQGINALVARKPHRAKEEVNETKQENKVLGGKDHKPQAPAKTGDIPERQDAAWTNEDDRKLKELKAQQKQWKDIAAELHRTPGQCKGRFKEINKDGNNNTAERKHGGDKAKRSGRDTKHDSKAKKSRPTIKAPSKPGSSLLRATSGHWAELHEDDMFSYGELKCLTEIIMQDDQQRWLRIAARFFDVTGRRVHQDDIRENFELLYQ